MRIPNPDDGSWLKPLKAEVQPTVFQKGRTYAETRRVLLVAVEDACIIGQVSGSQGQRYEVQVAPNSSGIGSTCNCAGWEKKGPHCKHVVGLALVYLAKLRASQNQSKAERVAAQPVLVQLEKWSGFSAVPEFEFFYRLSVSSIKGQAHRWMMDIRRLDAPGKGGVHVARQLEAGLRISPVDEKIFQALARCETRFDGRIFLGDEEMASLFPLLKERRVIYRGTPLVFAEHASKLLFCLAQKEGSLLAEFRLACESGESAGLKEVLLIPGLQSWVLWGQVLFRLESDFSPRLLRKWFAEPSMSFASSHLDDLLSYLSSVLPRYRLGFRAEGLKVEENLEPSFIVTLEGNTEQVCAKLVAKYGEHVLVPVAPVSMDIGYVLQEFSGERLLVLRSSHKEREAAKRLLEAGFGFHSASQCFELTGDAAIDFWFSGKMGFPPEWEVLFAQKPQVRLRSFLRPKIQIGMANLDWFELKAEFFADDQRADSSVLRTWLSSNRRYIPLGDGSFAQMDADELRKVVGMLEEAGLSLEKPKAIVPLSQAPTLDLLSNMASIEMDLKAKKAIERLREIDSIPTLSPPEGLSAILRGYQIAGLSWLWFLYQMKLSGVLADDMGLGKTVQALALLLKTKQEEGLKSSLVVAPTSVLANWEREIERFAPSLGCIIWHGQDRKEQRSSLKSADVVLTSYALIRRDVAELKKIPFRFVILDEAQNIKNADSATAQACKLMKADARVALTGTPLENRLKELWSIFDFLMPSFLGDEETFLSRFERPIAMQNDKSVIEHLKQRIRPFVLRRLKTEVAKDLPPKTETIAWCEMEAEQAALYREVLEESRRKVYETIERQGFGRSRVSILAALMRLRQVCCDPRLLKIPGMTSFPPSAKFERFWHLVDELVQEGHRALVFSQFTEMLQLLVRGVEEKKYGYLYLDGRTTDRMARVDAFNEPSGPPLFFISLKAGGSGLNLTAADYVIHYDPWWNPAVEDQATDRAHRIGQTRTVFSYKLITKGTVEEKILALQQRKRELVQGILGGDAELSKGFTEKDLEDLFEGDAF
ncbi:MAG: DEAD/DEAH box helicase [Cystobacterineae bacterium]|nr:DEAD/DEAH box helicase [Cystobacterineae bacterium]